MNSRKIAQEVFENEGHSLLSIAKTISREFELAVDAILECGGKLIVCGMGKSGIVGKKIAATLASTGTPSFFLHPGEAYHGDLGMIQKNDIVLLLSFSGETDEVLKLIPFLKNQENVIISITGNSHSTLAANSDFHLAVDIASEACPLQLAPTTSTTATMTMGDALAVSLMKMRDFKAEDFARFHPGGSLGRRLLTKVKDVMVSKNLPICKPECSVIEVISNINKGKLGICVILSASGVVGIISDGDLRRAMHNNQNEFFTLTAGDIMNVNPIFIHSGTSLVDAEQIMRDEKIGSLIVTGQNGEFSGVLEIYQD